MALQIKKLRPEYVKENEQVYRQLDPSEKQIVNRRVDQKKLSQRVDRERTKKYI